MLWTVSLNAILVTAANTIYMPGFKQVQDELDTTAAIVTLTVTSYTIGQGIQPLISGPLADSIGRRGPMLAAHVTFLAASIACALSPSIGFLIIARIFQVRSLAALLLLLLLLLRLRLPPHVVESGPARTARQAAHPHAARC